MKKSGLFKIAIVEDDEWFAKTLFHRLSMNPNFEISIFNTGISFREQLKNNFDLVLLDIRLPDTSGPVLFQWINTYSKNTDVAIVSAQADINIVVELLKKGVVDYLVKDEEVLEKAWNTAVKCYDHHRSAAKSGRNLSSKTQDNSMLGSCEQMLHVRRLIDKANRTTIAVCITGETGTGKELVAKAVHNGSERRDKPFVAVNVAAIPSELVESELFGHEKGAFTGATSRRIGKFEEANGGTLFLDEVGEMDLSMQTKLLRVLQERELTRVGGNETIRVDVRIVIATHRNLKREVEKKNFREDLYYRLLGLTIELPPLRERGKDIEILTQSFIADFCEANKINTKVMRVDALRKLRTHKFPGNVRELKAIVELACALAENSKEIGAEEIVFEKGSLKLMEEDDEMSLEEYNRRIIMHYLRKYNHRVVYVAEKLGIGKSTIYNLLKAHNGKSKLIETEPT